MSAHAAACADQAGLLALYERDREVHVYEEAELVRRDARPLHDADDSGSLRGTP